MENLDPEAHRNSVIDPGHSSDLVRRPRRLLFEKVDIDNFDDLARVLDPMTSSVLLRINSEEENFFARKAPKLRLGLRSRETDIVISKRTLYR